MNYFKILRFLQQGDRDAFSVSVESQRAFMESLGDAKNDIDRGFKQYLCQNYFVPQWKVVLFNIAGAIILPFVVILLLLKRCLVRKGNHVEAMIENKGMGEVVPAVVQEKYEPVCEYWREGVSMSLHDLGFLFRLILRAPLHPYFVLKAWMNVAYYSDMIYRHSPNVLIQFGEFSFSSSILTEYCHRNVVKHIDIMHGEKLWFIRDSFFHYDECYVWDEYYAYLFRSLKAEPSQFRVALPSSMKIDTASYKNQECYADYKYYLALYSEEQIKGIVQSMEFAKHEGKTVMYRPHPRYSDIELLRKYVKEEEIEMPMKVGIMVSISNLEFAVGSYTTVLSQAWFSDKGVVLDDVTFKDQFDKLEERGYILANKDCDRLSKYQQ